MTDELKISKFDQANLLESFDLVSGANKLNSVYLQHFFLMEARRFFRVFYSVEPGRLVS